eukprot:6468530-Amphidinium_carterae.1
MKTTRINERTVSIAGIPLSQSAISAIAAIAAGLISTPPALTRIGPTKSPNHAITIFSKVLQKSC